MIHFRARSGFDCLVPSRAVALGSLVALATLADCSCGSGGESGPIPLASLASEMAKMFCRRIYACCDVTERSIEGAAAANEATCVSGDRDGLSRVLVANLQEDVDAGRTAYHADRARECVDNFAALSCADWGDDFLFATIPGCAQISEGLLQLGHYCMRDQQCASGSCYGGVCVALAAAGAACARPTGCETGLYCSSVAGACAVLAPLGAPCDENDACENYTCVIPAVGGPGTCGRPTTCNGL